MNAAVAKFGFRSALVSFIGAAGYSIVQVMQVAGIIGKPMDDILIYGFSLVIAAPFMLAILALHYSVPEDKKIWTHAALLFAVMYAVYVSILYLTQLGVAIPLALMGTPDAAFGVSRFTAFWTQDGLGYICMGLATLFAVPAVGALRGEEWMRRFFLANGLFTAVITFVYFYPAFSVGLLLIGFPWIITGPGSILFLMLYFRKKLHG